MPVILKDSSNNILKDEYGNILRSLMIDNGVKLNGTDDEILISAINALLKIPASVPYSILMVIGVNSINAANKAILNSRDGANNGISIAFNGSTDLLFNMGTSSSGNRLLKTFTGMGPAVNEIAAIGWTKSNLNTLAALKGYKHGREITTTGGASTLSTFSYSTTHPMRVGNDPTTAGRYGAFTIWDLAILREEVSAADMLLYAFMDGKYLPDGSRIVDLSGTVTVTSGNASVTGSGTIFTKQCKVGKALFDSSNVYLGNIASITSDTALTLVANAAASASGTVRHGSTILKWEFEELSGTTVADSSGVGQSGTISGSSSTSAGGTNMHVNNAWQSIT